MVLPAAVFATDYYIDATQGDDAHPGTSPASPWRSLDKVNATIFHPGESLLFKAGEHWTGQLHPQGSGAPGQPIILDQYGSGPKPIIDANGTVGEGTLLLTDQQFWEINHLELTNNADHKGDRRGIYIKVSSSAGALFRHLVIRHCDIHHIKGIAAETGDKAKRTGGIIIEAINEGATRTRFDDILVEDCSIYTVDNIGIALNSVLKPAVAPDNPEDDNETEKPDATKSEAQPYPGTPDWEARKFTHVALRGNKIHDVAKNAIIVRFTDETGLIEHNQCWDTAHRAKSGNTIFSRTCRGTVFQYNEGYLNRATGRDGSLYDADLQSPGCIFQYSYSHDNNEGLFWQCTAARDQNVIVRHNVSQNDKGIIFCLNYAAVGTRIYNNIVFIGPDRSPTVISERKNSAQMRSYEFINNIVYNLSPKTKYHWFNATRSFDSNLFFGLHPAGEPEDLHKLVVDPLFQSPGTGGIGLNTLEGYRLTPGSPAVRSGKPVSAPAPVDFWHNAIPLNAAPNRGI